MDNPLIPIVALGAAVAFFSWLDLSFFGRRAHPTFRQAAAWSIGWLVLAFLAAIVIWPLRGGDDAVLYLTVYLIERSLSLDNVFVFLILFTYFGIEPAYRGRLIVWGVVIALALRGGAILGGLALLERFEALVYVLAAVLLFLAIRVGKGLGEEVDPDRNLMIRAVRRLFPLATTDHRGRWFLRRHGTLYTTPLLLCFVGIIFTDIIFAVDSIPAAFAITREPFVIWMGNVFALLGLRALLILVERLIERFRYLDQTIAVVLAVIAVKLIVEEAGLVHVGPLASLAIVGGLIAIGIVLSLLSDRRDVGRDVRREGPIDPQSSRPGS